MLGKTLDDKYRIERLLGSGGMGSVYAADDLRTGQKVAIKVIHANLHDSAALVQRFEREARAAGSIDTEHIARCYDAGTDPETGSPYMVLEYLVGEDLHHLIKRLGPLPPELALRITAQACLGVSKAHEANIVHRDIKPANIFLARGSADGTTGVHTVKVLDFGVAKIRRDPSDIGAESTSGGLTRTGSLLGSPLYMSPEQARSVKNIDHRADIWSLGVVLFQAVAGRTPYEDVTGLGDLILALCSDLPPPVQDFAPWVTPEVAAVIDHALRLDPDERFQTAAEMASALRALVPGRGTIWGAPGSPESPLIHDSMLIALDDETHDHIAPTFSRRDLSVMPRLATWRSNSSSNRVSSTSNSSTPAAFAGTVLSEPGLAPARAGEATPPPSSRQQSTQSAVSTSTTGARLPAGGSLRADGSAAPRTLPMIAVAVACVLAGGAGVYAFTRTGISQAGPSAAGAPPPTAIATATSAAVVAPVLPAATAEVRPAPVATGAATESPDAATAPAARGVVAPPSHAPHTHAASAAATTMTTTTAPPVATAPPTGTVLPLDHTSFGDRK